MRGSRVAIVVTVHPDLDVERITREAALVVDFRGATRHSAAKPAVTG